MHYWTGNAAKARVMGLMLADPRERLTVLDYGAGRGGDWPDVLVARPGLELVCYEPSTADCAVLAERLRHLPARVLSTGEFEREVIGADYIVSFSVLEHVHDKAGYMRHAKRQLAADGTFFLNYDDGHFRTALDLDDLRDWRANIAVTLQNRLAWLWPRIGKWQRYQARVPRSEMQRLVADAGFDAADDRYENLENMKALAKTIPADRAQAFMAFWLEVEGELNQRFRAVAEQRRGDTANLWRVMASRTLALRHA